MVKQYELLYIIPATFTDEDVGGIESNVKALLEKHGATIDSTSRLGKFRFAYPIKKVRHGHYQLVRFSADSAAISVIEAALRISTEVLRYLVLRSEEAGGEKFDLVQFTEVNLDLKEGDDRRPRRRDEAVPAGKADERKEEIKSGVAVLEGEEAKSPQAEAVPQISAEELEKKIEAALKDDTKEA